jgi:hypothetical protein
MNYTEIECFECDEECDEERATVDPATGTMTLPKGWRWGWGLCNWGNGITWHPVCPNCAEEKGEAYFRAPDLKVRKRALKGVSEWARFPEERPPLGPAPGAATKAPPGRARRRGDAR